MDVADEKKGIMATRRRKRIPLAEKEIKRGNQFGFEQVRLEVPDFPPSRKTQKVIRYKMWKPGKI